jgi:serine/threonine protein kinase
MHLQEQEDSIFQWLAQKTGLNPLNTEERVVFYTKFMNFHRPVKDKLLSIGEARTLVENVRKFLRSQSRRVLLQHSSYLFDGLLGQTAGGKALLYHAINIQNRHIVCAKVYNVNEEVFQAEIDASNSLHSDGEIEGIVHYFDVVTFSHETAQGENMVALMMPLYQICLREVMEAFMDIQPPLQMFNLLATTLLRGGSRFHELNLSHCDIKPENIMLHNGNFVLIDLGGVVNIGQPIRDCTPSYILDARTDKVDFTLDLYCIAVTLVRFCCANYDIRKRSTKEKLLSFVQDQYSISDYHKEVINLCLTSTNCIEAYNKFLALDESHK